MSNGSPVFEAGLSAIPPLPRPDRALDHENLFLAGLAHVRRLSELVWTDHNFHDPGITALELICFALTDLGYRASLPIADRSVGADEHSTLFAAPDILPPAPLTVLDYRQLLVDCDGVANAWLTPRTESWHLAPAEGRAHSDASTAPRREAVAIRGLWDVMLDLTPRGQARKPAVIAEVERRLAAARNLCEEFAEIRDIVSDEFRLCAEIEVTPGADLVAIAARALHAVGQVLAPTLPRYSLAERLALKRDDGSATPMEEIFSGPLPLRGFVLAEDLERAELQTSIQLSDVFRALHGIDGVMALRDVVVARLDEADPARASSAAPGQWKIAVRPGRKPALNAAASRIVFYKRGVPLHAEASAVEAELRAIAARAEARVPEGLPALPAPAGRARELARYTSIEQHFPVAYGLSRGEAHPAADGGPQSAATPEAHATENLRAYLLFFDQLFANYLALLAAVPRLLSADPELGQTYFVQAVTRLGQPHPAYLAADGGSLLGEDALERATELVSRAFVPDERGGTRRHRFLDHLTARFAETFHELAWVLYEKFGHSQEALARVKCAFLSDVPALTRERGLGANLSEHTRGLSGFERRLCALLDLPKPLRTSFAAVLYETFEIAREQPKEARGRRVWFGFRVRDAGSNENLFWSTDAFSADSGAPPDASEDERRAAERRARTEARAKAERALLRTLHLLRNEPLASEADAFGRGGPVVLSEPEEHRFVVIDERGEKLAIRKPFATAAGARRALAEVRARIGEGLFVVENLWLRPRIDRDPAPCLCVDPGCEGCEEHDPYSFRLQVILPAEAGRFRDADFRRFAEQVIRDETPAHLLPKICWLAREEMLEFETAQAAFLELPADADPGVRAAALGKLIEVLWRVRSVHPPAHLNESASEPSADPFLLDRGRLGSRPE